MSAHMRLERIRQTRNVEEFHHGPRFDVENRLERVREELRNTIAMLGQIKYIFLYGDQRDDLEFRGLLAEMLGSELVEDACVDGSAWTSPGAMAASGHFIMDHSDFPNDYEKSTTAFGCKWRSKLYHAGHDEL